MASEFTDIEQKELPQLLRNLLLAAGDSIAKPERKRLYVYLREAADTHALQRNNFDMHPIVSSLQSALLIAQEMGIKGSVLVAVMLYEPLQANVLSLATAREEFGDDTANILTGLAKVNELYSKNPVVESENFRRLLLSFAEDMRVILIMIAVRLNVMRQIRDTLNEEDRTRVANEAAYLYAPLAHKLGLYQIKSELEDLSLKYTNRDIYYNIKEKLNETKASRDKYIAAFIRPIEEKLREAGLKFEVKGRTKSIHSIWNKIRKNKVSFEGIYDLFAVRIILDAPPEKEKQACWLAFSLVTDMYRPDTNRLRNWLSIPKSNGYESLHITVMGPEGKWVEVQIRTQRMDEIAERGVAAHWRYKGVKGESGLDEWLVSVREALENADGGDSLRMMDQFKRDLSEEEVYVFTPRGDLFKLSKGATVLDFAFHIHTKLGSKCIGARVNGKIVPIRYKLSSGDQVEVMTANNQTPKQDWLNIVTTARARTKIRQTLKEMAGTQLDFAKETLERKFKNRKLEYDDAMMMKLVKRLGYKNVTLFYQAIAEGTLDVNAVIERYIEQQKKDSETSEVLYRSAEGFNIPTPVEEESGKEDVLVIDQNLKGIEYTLAKCCNPIYGDEVFGFTTVSGGMKIHRTDCPNAPQMRERFGYRIIKARWAGKSRGKHYPITLRVVGHDDIGIVTNITSIISKETDITLRSISIDSHDGLFSGMLTVMVGDTGKLEALLKKLRTVKGVKQVSRN
ncbi:MAG: RelA/SpoT family protein [Prevotellaceae bacterium]|jgi:GTP pyrophosphokinase|nr:RelA/SpoT family protein [Prevotellaceae bacterium]